METAASITAHAFYLALGYTDLRESETGFGLTYLMRKPLPSPLAHLPAALLALLLLAPPPPRPLLLAPSSPRPAPAGYGQRSKGYSLRTLPTSEVRPRRRPAARGTGRGVSVGRVTIRREGLDLAGRRRQGVLFDCDGVLVDSDASVERAWRRWTSDKYGMPPQRCWTWRTGAGPATPSPAHPRARAGGGAAPNRRARTRGRRHDRRGSRRGRLAARHAARSLGGRHLGGADPGSGSPIRSGGAARAVRPDPGGKCGRG